MPFKSVEAKRRWRREYGKRNPERVRAWCSAYRKKRPLRDVRRERQLALAPYPPPALCECCGEQLEKPHFDHDHGTGAFRGWLCGKCNKGLGLLGDSLSGVERAATYLRGALALC